jgi:outer membrane protein TolC
VPGASVTASVRYSFPLKNNAARGILLQSTSKLRQAVIQTKDLARNIHSNVAVALTAVKNGVAELKKSRKAVEAYKLAVEDEKLKYMYGMSTIIDIINTQDRLTDAKLDEIAAHSSLANSIAGLRYETGTLISTTAEGKYAVTMDDLTTIPLDLIQSPESAE